MVCNVVSSVACGVVCGCAPERAGWHAGVHAQPHSCTAIHRYWRDDIPCGLASKGLSEKGGYGLADGATTPLLGQPNGGGRNGGGRKRHRGAGETSAGQTLVAEGQALDEERARHATAAREQEHRRRQDLVNSLDFDASLEEALLATLDAWNERGGRNQMSALQQATTQRHLLVPRAGICDGSKGIISALNEWFPGVPRIGCFAHIVFNSVEKNMLPPNHPAYASLKDVLQEMHTCHTEGMWKALKKCLKKTWHRDPALLSFYKKVFSGPDARWFLGALVAGAIIPSQNTQEVCS